MGLRFRRSVKICKGVRLNFSKSGIGLSVGVRGARYSIGANGRNIVTVGVPGTGIYYSKSASRYQQGGSQGYITNGGNKNTTVHYANGQSYTYTPSDVQRYKEVIRILTKAHSTCSEPVDWVMLRDANPPFEKGTTGPLEAQAKARYDAMKPTLAEKLFASKFEQRKAEEYEKVKQAKLDDDEAYSAWESSRECAVRILSGDIDAYDDAVHAADPFVDLSRIGSDFEFGTDKANYMEVEFKALLDKIIPSEKLELTATGKVSRKVLTKTEMYDIALDYVCGCAIRLARELFALLPIDTVIAHAVQETSDGRGGITEETILSVKFEKVVFDTTNFNRIDASDFVETFIHNLKFLKTQGFRSVERITPDTIDYRVAPTEESNSRKKTKEAPSTVKVELPFGWYSQNEGFIKPRDEKLFSLMRNTSGNNGISAEISALKELIAYYLKYKDECIDKGIFFEKYFDDMHMHNGGKRYNYVKAWKKRLEELEDSYLDVKETEDAIAQARPTIKADLISLISSNPGILQKEVYGKFNPLIKQLIMDTLYELLTEGRLTKEKAGNSNKLFIKQ